MRIRYIMGEVFKGLFRNKSMVASVVLVTFVSLAFVGAASLLQRQIGLLKGDWYELIEVSVFLCPSDSLAPTCAGGEATEAQIAEIRHVIATELSKDVSSVLFESKEMALADFQSRSPDGYQGMQLTAEDMQASLRLKVTDPANFALVSEVLAGRAGVEDVVDHRAVFGPLFTALNRASALAGGLAAVMLLTATLLIGTTIKLSALSRRKETSIMRLVGASNWVIQLPFVLEGAVAALIGSALAIGALWLVLKVVINGWLQQSVNWVAYVSARDLMAVAPMLIVGALALAMIASITALRRHARA